MNNLIKRGLPLLLTVLFLGACTNPFFAALLGEKEKPGGGVTPQTGSSAAAHGLVGTGEDGSGEVSGGEDNDGGEGNDEDGNGKTTTYTVTFNADGWMPAPEAQTVAEGGTVTEPPPITKAGYVFAGWYQEAALTNAWNFAADTVTADITLYAYWIPFNMVNVPGGHTFPTGTGDGGTATVDHAYEIGETEVTYELWYTVRVWAEDHGYTFSNNPGREGNSGADTAPGARKQEPVTQVTWFDAVVWLNALTEWVNAKTGSSFEPVYYYESTYTTVARDSTPTSNFAKEGGHAHASAYAKPGAAGFRLPTSDEWELAARWRNDSTNTVSSYTNPYFTKGNSASGATAYYNNAAATGAVAWYTGSGSFKTQAVKGKAANGLGLYDMSGNVREWCYDWHPACDGSNRILRGGSWYYKEVPSLVAFYLQVGFEFNFDPVIRDIGIGFRPARTAQ